MGEVRSRLLGNLLGSLAVLAVAAAVAIGLPALDRALPAARPVTHGQPYGIGAGVTVVPPAGALLDVTKTRPGPRRGTALFLLGSVRYAVVVGPFTGSLPEAAARLRHKITATRGCQVTGTERPVTTGAGVGGRAGGYAAPGRAGRYSVFLVRGLAVEVTVSGTQADLRGALGRVEASTASLAFGRRP
ncbi:MAG TPA: hypothetical protein VES42_21535 [Pilimelia sp.]|nr:hypothetical protein [Pilimelia sp.]